MDPWPMLEDETWDNFLEDWMGPALQGLDTDLGFDLDDPVLNGLQFGQPQTIPGALPVFQFTSCPANSTLPLPSAQPQGLPSAQSKKNEPKSRRKRASVSAQLAELQRRLEAQTAALQQLSMQNLWLTERLKVLELVVAVRDAQLIRVKAVQAGLTFEPFHTHGVALADMDAVTPGMAVNKMIQFHKDVASLLSPVLSHLQQNPHLLYGPDPDTCWRYSDPTTRNQPGSQIPQAWRTTRRPAPPPPPPPPATHLSHGTITIGPPGLRTISTPTPGMAPVSQPSSPGMAGTSQTMDLSALSGMDDDARVCQQLQALVDFVESVTLPSQYVVLLKPHVILASSLNQNAVDPKLHTNWESLHSSVHATHQQQAQHTNTPLAANEEHWKRVASGLMLSDHQKLQVSVLHDLISNAVKAVLSQRAALSAQIASINQLGPKTVSYSGMGLKSASGPGPCAAGSDSRAMTALNADNATSQMLTGAMGSGLLSNSSEHNSKGCSRTQSGLSQGGSNISVQTQELQQGQQQHQLPQPTGSGQLVVKQEDGEQQEGSVSVEQGKGSAVPFVDESVWMDMKEMASMLPYTMTEGNSLIKQLQMTLVKERCLYMLGKEVLFDSILTPVQMALGITRSDPYVVDEMAILHALASEFNPQVLSRLQNQ